MNDASTPDTSLQGFDYETLSCANCSSAGKQETFSPYLKLNAESDADQFVSVHEAVTIIYTSGLNLQNQEYWLCMNCNEILTQLYYLFRDFKDLCNPKSEFGLALSKAEGQGCDTSRSPSPPHPTRNTSEEIYEQILFPICTDTQTVKLRLKRRSERRKLFRQAFPPKKKVTNTYNDDQAPQNTEKDVGDSDGEGDPELDQNNTCNEWSSKRIPSGSLQCDPPVIATTSLKQKKRGRPRKSQCGNSNTTESKNNALGPVLKRSRGRPRKSEHGRPSEGTSCEGTSDTFKRNKSLRILTAVRLNSETNDIEDGQLDKVGPETPIQLEDACNPPAPVTNVKNTSTLGRPRGRKNNTETWRDKLRLITRYRDCLHCNKACNNAWDLFLHLRSEHKRTRSFPCPICPKEFVAADGLQIHLRVTHAEEGSNPRAFVCDVTGCGMSFAYTAGLRAHGFTHDKTLQRFQCEECGKKSRSAHDLKIHMAVHTNVRNFTCEQCGATFKTRNALRRHHRFMHPATYDGEGRAEYSCPVCQKPFNVPGNMTQHIRNVHYQIKSYQCRLCAKMFSSSSNLKVHLRGFHSLPESEIKILKVTNPPTMNDSSSGKHENEMVLVTKGHNSKSGAEFI